MYAAGEGARVDDLPDEPTEITVTEELLAGIEAKLDTAILWLQVIAGLLLGIGFISAIN